MLVVLLHISSEYVYKGMELHVFDSKFWAGNIINSFTRISVPLFILISGRFLLGRKQNMIVFYKTKLNRILIPMAVWGVLYALFNLALNYKLRGEWDVIFAVKSYLFGYPFYHLWYLYMLLGLYAMTPWLNYFILETTEKQLSKIVVFFMVLGFSVELYNEVHQQDPIFLVWSIKYIGYFLMGYYLKNTVKKNSLMLLLAYILSSISIIFFSYYTAKEHNSLYFNKYVTPFVIIGAISLYKYFSQLNIQSNFLTRTAHLTFGIYLIHAGVLIFVNKGYRLFIKSLINNLYGEITLKFITTYILSLAIIYFANRIKWLKKII